jgi:hypothetical protein
LDKQDKVLAGGEKKIVLARAKELQAAKKTARRKQAEDKEREVLRAAVEKIGDRPWELTAEQDVIQCNALITDPPYGILKESWEPDSKSIETITREWASRWSDCGADFLLMFFSQRYLWEGRRWFDESLPDYAFQQLLVWHYANNKSPQSRMGFKQTWEPIFFYRRKGSEKKITIGGKGWGDDIHDFDCHVAAVPQSNFKDENRKIHPAQKPVSVMRWLVNATTAPGDLVVDPFCGSGTTGIAAVQLKRKFHGIETDSEMLAKAEERIACYGTV